MIGTLTEKSVSKLRLIVQIPISTTQKAKNLLEKCFSMVK